MKSILRREQGYALVTVLMIIIIFSVLSLAFMTQSISSMKQNSVVEKKSQSVELAEMGAQYFQTIGTNAFNQHIQSTISQVENELNQDLTKGVMNSENHYTKMAKALLIAHLKNDLKPTSVPIKGNANASFKIDQISFKNPSDLEMVINSVSIGNMNGDESEIGASLLINFEDFITVVENEDTDNPINKNLPKGNEIEEPTTTTSCKEGNDFSQANCQIIGNKAFDDNTNDVKFNQSTVKINGSLTINGNMNNTIYSSTLYIKDGVYFKRQSEFNNSKLYVGGVPNFDETVTFENKSSVYFGKLADFKFNLNFSNSDLYAAEGIFFKKPSKIENNSNFYISGFADFEETIEITNNSNLYLGSADFKKNFTLDGSTLYIAKGNVNSNDKTTFTETVDIRNGSDFYIGSSTYFKKNFKLTNSTLFIDGNAEFDETLDISNNAKLCVNGFFDLKHNQNINMNDTSKVYAKTTNSSRVNTSEFEQACKRNTSTNKTILWEEPDIDSEFDYNY